LAIITYYPGMASDMIVPSLEGQLMDHGETFAEFLTAAAGDSKLFLGQGFVYAGDELVAGTATEFVYRAGADDLYRISGVSWDMSLGMPDLFAGDDTITGSRGTDYINGGDGSDMIRGGRGRDFIRGDAGNDVLRGEAGSDIFIFYPGGGTDKIMDFDVFGAQQDVLAGATQQDSAFDIRQRGHDVVLDFGGGDRIILRHVDLDDLSPRNFELS
jgi:hypothetical protein